MTETRIERHHYDVVVIGAGGAGLRAAIAAELAGRHGVELPVTDAVAAMIEGRLDVHAAVEQLMTRPITTE